MVEIRQFYNYLNFWRLSGLNRTRSVIGKEKDTRSLTLTKRIKNDYKHRFLTKKKKDYAKQICPSLFSAERSKTNDTIYLPTFLEHPWRIKPSQEAQAKTNNDISDVQLVLWRLHARPVDPVDWQAKSDWHRRSWNQIYSQLSRHAPMLLEQCKSRVILNRYWCSTQDQHRNCWRKGPSIWP